MLHHPDAPGSQDTFADRADAGRRLLEAVQQVPDLDINAVLAVPRGGLPIALPVALALNVPLDVLIARKIGAPFQPELAIGAVTRLGVVWNQDLLDVLNLSEADLEPARIQALAEVVRRERMYRRHRPATQIAGRSVLVVDDGLATGATMAAAVDALQHAHAAKVIVGVGVASTEAVARFQEMGALVLAVMTPPHFVAVGEFFRRFNPVPDEECMEILDQANSLSDARTSQPLEPRPAPQIDLRLAVPRGTTRSHVVDEPFELDVTIVNDGSAPTGDLLLTVRGSTWAEPMYARPGGPLPDGLIRSDPVSVSSDVPSLDEAEERRIRFHCRALRTTANPRPLLAAEVWQTPDEIDATRWLLERRSYTARIVADNERRRARARMQRNVDTTDEERLRRREYETFLRLAEADETMRVLLRKRVRFPGEGEGYPDPLDKKAAAALVAAMREANQALDAWQRAHDELNHRVSTEA
jgi:putative phosphoribosyl transferase